MPLQKQIVPINFSQGVDTKTDPKQVVPGKLLSLENGIFISKNRIKKRNGFKSLGNQILGSSATLPSGNGVMPYNNELLQLGKTLYSYNEGTAKWVDKGHVSSVSLDSKAVVRNTYQQTVPDSCYHSATGLYAYAWEDSSGGVRYSIIDDSTGDNIIHDQLVQTGSTAPKVFALGNYIVILYVYNNHIYFSYVSIFAPNAALTKQLFANNLNVTSKNYDATTINGRIYVAFDTSNAGGAVSVGYILPSMVPSFTPTANGEAATNAITIFEDSLSNNVVITYADNANVKYVIFSYDLYTQVVAPAVVSAIANTYNITGFATKGATRNITLFYTISAVSKINYYIKKVTIAPAVGTPTVLIRSVGLTGKAFSYNSVNYFTCVFDSAEQPTYFVVDENSNVVAKFLPSNSGGVSARHILSEMNIIGDGIFQQAILVKDLLTSISGSIYTQTGVQTEQLNFFDPQESYLRVELGNNLHISGGIISMYDGVSVVEHGFNIYPEQIAKSESASGGSIGGGIFGYSVTYEWTDNQGQLHRSAPSIPVQTSLLTGSTNQITLTIPTLRVTAKTNTRSPVIIVIYRTEGNGTTYYQISSITSPLINDPTVDTVTYIDSAADTSIVGNPLLYTTGGVLDNNPAPGCSEFTTYKNRIFAIPYENKNEIIYSKQVFPGVPVEFSDLLSINIDPKGGDVTALGAIDDKLIIFKQNAIFFMAGTGPDSTGAQNDFNDPQLLTSDNGCTNPRSIINVPMGLMYQSSKGIYLLDRSMQVSYIGMDVEAYNSYNVTSAILIPSTNQVRFGTDGSVTLVYDYLFQQWSVFTGIPSIDACVFQNLYTYLRSDGIVFQETPGIFIDDQNQIKLSLTSSWLSFAGLQGFQRVYKLLILGEYISPHKLHCSISYNFNPNATQEDYIDATSLLDNSTYGESGKYGIASPYGIDDGLGEYPIYQWRIHLAQQKCQSIQVTLEDVQADNFGEGLSLSAITLEVGAKAGLNKVSATRSFG